MKHVWVVMGGCIDDYHICSIWTSEKKANEEVKRMNNDKWDKQLEPWVEKWEVK